MKKGLKCSIIVLISLMAFERLISAEDEDDIAWEKINNLLIRYPRMIPIENQNSNDFNEKELASKLNNLLEFHRRDSPFVSYDPVDKQDQESTDDDSKDCVSKTTTMEATTIEERITKKDETITKKEETSNESSTKPQRLHNRIIDKIRQKLPGSNSTRRMFHEYKSLTLPLPWALIIFGITIIVTCLCSLFVRNRLAACFNKLTGKNKKKKKSKSKMLFADAERGRSIPRTRKKSISSRRSRARSLSQDIRNVAIQKNSTITTTNENDEPSTTGCYACCKKKKKRSRKNKK